MSPKLKDIVIVLTILGGFAHALYVYSDLPDLIPVHFNFQGEPDVFAALPNGAFLVLIVAIVVALVLRVVMSFPSAQEIKAYLHNVCVVLVAAMVALNVIILEYAMGSEVVPARFAWLFTGVILIAVSNPMGKLPINRYAGIRIPSTVDNPEVWQRTNRFAGWVGVVLGLGMVIAYFAPVELPILALLACMIVFALAIVLYARRLNKLFSRGSSA